MVNSRAETLSLCVRSTKDDSNNYDTSAFTRQNSIELNASAITMRAFQRPSLSFSLGRENIEIEKFHADLSYFSDASVLGQRYITKFT